MGRNKKKKTRLLKIAKEQKIKYKPTPLSNGDSPKQLLARSRYVIAKNRKEWTKNQQEKAELLFKLFPDIKFFLFRLEKLFT